MKNIFTSYLLAAIISGLCSANEIQHISPQTPSIHITDLLNQHIPQRPVMAHCDAYKHQNSTIFYENLHNYTAEQLQQYFNAQHYSEVEILDQPLLYLSTEFVKLAKTYDGYEQAIEILHKKFQNFGPLKKAFHAFTGTYASGLKRRIGQLYQEIQLKKAYQQKQQLAAKQEQTLPQKHSSYDSYISQYHELKSVYEQYSPLLAKAIEKRIQVKHSPHQLQKTIYLESEDIIKEVNILPAYSILHPHQNALIDCATAINDYNSQGILDKAMCIADFCWTLLDYGQAIAEGAALGLYSTAQDFIENPIQATVCIVAGKQVLAYQLCKVLYNVADIGATAITNYDRAKEKWDDYLAPLNNLITAINNKEITLRDSLKTGTALVVGYKAQNKLLGGLGNFFTTIKQRAVTFAINNPLFGPQEYLATPEGILLKATNQVKKDFEKTNLSNLKNIVENKITRKQSIKGLIKKEGLPNKGKLRYVPPKKFHASEGLPTVAMPNGRPGFKDRFGNIWVQGDSRTKGQAFEWDVQLSKQGIQQVGWMTRDNTHLNVSLDGRVTHK